MEGDAGINPARNCIDGLRSRLRRDREELEVLSQPLFCFLFFCRILLIIYKAVAEEYVPYFI